MEEVHGELYAMTEKGLWDLSWWWKASFDEVFSDELVQNHREDHSVDVIDNRSKYEEAKLAYFKFYNCELNDGAERSVYL